MSPAPVLRNAVSADISAVVEVHRRAFPEAFLTLLGGRFLAAYYSLLLGYAGGALLVAERENRLAGFAAGCLAPEQFHALMRAAKPLLGSAALGGLVRRPSLLPRLLANYRRTAPAKRPATAASTADAELTSLAVDPADAGHGLGSALVEALAAKLADGGAATLELTTDAAGNEGARRFYERLGFRVAGRYSPYSGRTLLRYQRTLSGRPASRTRPSPEPAHARGLGRLFDLVAAASGLLLAAPLLAVLAAAVKLADGGPAFYRHQRVGRHGRLFSMWKLRTMTVGADRIGGPLTAGGDPRVTPLGRLLRRFKLDETPQLLNVLAGQMSFVGPRPESPAYVDPLDPRWRQVLAVRPGVTDLASLAYRNEEDLLAQASDREVCYRTRILPAKLALNLEGLERRSRLFDLRLIAYTVRYSLFPRGFDSALIRRSFVEDAHA